MLFDNSYYDKIIKSNGYLSVSDRESQCAIEALFGHEVPSIIATSCLAPLPAKKKIAVVTGIGINGVPHLGTLRILLQALELQKRGYYVQIVLADFDVRNTRKTQWRTIERLTAHYYSFIKSLGFVDDGIKGSVKSQYENLDNMRVAYMLSSTISDEDFIELEEDIFTLYKKQNIYSGLSFSVKQAMALQIADFISPLLGSFNKVVTLSGIDEHPFARKANEICERYLSKKNAIAGIFFDIIPGFKEYPKMSKSIKESSISLDMEISETKQLYDYMRCCVNEDARLHLTKIINGLVSDDNIGSYYDNVDRFCELLKTYIIKWKESDEITR